MKQLTDWITANGASMAAFASALGLLLHNVYPAFASAIGQDADAVLIVVTFVATLLAAFKSGAASGGGGDG